MKAPAPVEENTSAGDDAPNDTEAIFCELCKSSEHDTLDCTSLRSAASDTRDDREHEPAAMPKPLSLGKENENDDPAPKKADAPSKVDEEEKWCALCEKDGHLAFDCPDEQY